MTPRSSSRPTKSSRQGQGDQRSSARPPDRRRDLPGGRPGPRRRSDLRSPGEVLSSRRAEKRLSGNRRQTGKNGQKAIAEAEARSASRPKKRSAAADRPKKIFRVMFNEITQKAMRAAFENPAQVDTDLVDAQQARRVLDRIVGYKSFAAALGQSSPRPFRRARADRRAAADRRARAGNPRVRPAGILDHPRAARSRRAACV